ncbi:undecaprenyl-diphosphate phosphatase [Salinigranum sp. GCM10025319]|uniref:undecaprenyl-diphosphate phosphatase n=1 Tax=Salinigranum sp. GCM10025319 TaxID=3252687 RepID=UPI0036064704
MDRSLVVALVVGVLQGVFEWLPISSEGNITLYLVVVEGMDPTLAVQLSLFLHAGTGLAACAYYRHELRTLFDAFPTWRLTGPATSERATLSFLVVGTLSSVVVGLLVYRLLIEFVTELAGGAFVALIGGLLVVTGLIQRVGDEWVPPRDDPSLVDAVLVGTLQGVAILPGVSRSGVTAGALLLRGHEAIDAFRLSFLLSIPAAFGAGVLVLLDVGVPSVSPPAAGVALATSAVVGYATIGLLLAVVRRVSFWAVAIGLGVLAIVGGLGAGL